MDEDDFSDVVLPTRKSPLNRASGGDWRQRQSPSAARHDLKGGKHAVLPGIGAARAGAAGAGSDESDGSEDANISSGESGGSDGDGAGPAVLSKGYGGSKSTAINTPPSSRRRGGGGSSSAGGSDGGGGGGGGGYALPSKGKGRRKGKEPATSGTTSGATSGTTTQKQKDRGTAKPRRRIHVSKRTTAQPRAALLHDLFFWCWTRTPMKRVFGFTLSRPNIGSVSLLFTASFMLNVSVRLVQEIFLYFLFLNNVGTCAISL